MVELKTVSIRADWSADRLSSFWNWASRHQGNPNDCARPGTTDASDKTTTSHPARQVELIRKPLKKRLLQGLRRGRKGRLADDNLLLMRGRRGTNRGAGELPVVGA